MSLREINESDLGTLLKWRNAPEVRNNMYTTHVIHEAEHSRWFDIVKKDLQSLWFMYENEDTTPNGVVYFTQYVREKRSSFWGFYAAPDAPKGTGSKMCFEALDMAFSSLDLHKLNAEVFSSNERSIHLHQKLGFVREGCFRDFHFDGTNYIDVIRFGILKSEWIIRRQKLIQIIG